jgi:uncharacterized membrane protein
VGGLQPAAARLHVAPFDPAPFSWLQGMITTAALYIAILILTTQRRENLLAEHRAQLTLEISMVNEQKTAKLIQMIEQLRRDNPLIENHLDPEAIAMSQPADPQAMLDAIKETHQEMLADEAESPQGSRVTRARRGRRLVEHPDEAEASSGTSSQYPL